MKIEIAVSMLAATVLAGCVCCSDSGCSAEKKECLKKDPVIGNWSAKLPYETMPASSMIFTRGEDGKPAALVLWRWGSPMQCTDVKVSGDSFSFVHPYGQKFEGQVLGGRMFARIAPCDAKTGKLKGAWQPFEGYRNPSVPCGVSTDDAVFGDPVDILKDGLAGFASMSEIAMDKTWSFKDGVLSNRVKGPDGKHIQGANIMTKRADFYDFKLDYDVRVPKDSNSGMYLRGRFEIQTLDSYGKDLDCHNMAAYYGRVTPKVAAEKPAGEWQHVTVVLYKRHLTVTLNGKRIIDNAPVVGVTGGAIDADLFKAGPLYIQGDHSDADYRNVILRPAL